VAFKRFTSIDLQSGIAFSLAGEQIRKIAAKMNAQGKEIGNHDNAFDAGADGFRDRCGKVRLRHLEKRRAHVRNATGFLYFAREFMHAIVGFFHAAAVREEKNSCFGLILCHNRSETSPHSIAGVAQVYRRGRRAVKTEKALD